MAILFRVQVGGRRPVEEGSENKKPIMSLQFFF